MEETKDFEEDVSSDQRQLSNKIITNQKIIVIYTRSDFDKLQNLLPENFNEMMYNPQISTFIIVPDLKYK